jgi:hypothetical protein
MAFGKLTPVQVEVLRALAGIVPRWRLCGGAALAGFHTRHRTTRDLDLLWEAPDLKGMGVAVEQRLVSAGFTFDVLQRAPAFQRYRVKRGDEVLVVDLIAEPVPTVASPMEQAIDDRQILVDAPHEILVAKLTALLGRSELRDLEDVGALLEAGGDLDRALVDAPRKDAGFSPPTLAWVLDQFPVQALGRTLGRSPEEIERACRLRDALVSEVLAASKPG